MLNIRQYPKVITLLFFIMLTACTSQHSSDNNILVGIVTKDELLKKEKTFSENYRDFSLATSDKAFISHWPENLHIDIYFGTWCHDSKREVPNILSILDESKQVTYRLIALDFNNNYPENSIQAINVKFTPTIVVYLGDKEIGRIIERPIDSLVKDITRFYVKSLKVID